MNKTGIEWTDYTWNPVTGCLNNCEYCYARKLAKRFKFKNGFRPTFHPDRLNDPEVVKHPSKIFVCSMADLFGDWVSPLWVSKVMNTVGRCEQHTFQFLTKFPQNLRRYNPWPRNAWVGATATDDESFISALCHLAYVRAPVRFISIEPFLSPIRVNGPQLEASGIDWLIIGAQTNPLRLPDSQWVADIAGAAVYAGIPIFIKNNMKAPTPIQCFPRAGIEGEMEIWKRLGADNIQNPHILEPAAGTGRYLGFQLDEFYTWLDKRKRGNDGTEANTTKAN